MKGKKIEKRPPTLTGDPKEDNRRLSAYLDYLYEQLNYILTLLYKDMRED